MGLILIQFLTCVPLLWQLEIDNSRTERRELSLVLRDRKLNARTCSRRQIAVSLCDGDDLVWET